MPAEKAWQQEPKPVVYPASVRKQRVDGVCLGDSRLSPRGPRPPAVLHLLKITQQPKQLHELGTTF